MDNLNLSILKESFKKTLQKTNKSNFLLAVSGGIDSMLLHKIATLIKNLNFHKILDYIRLIFNINYINSRTK